MRWALLVGVFAAVMFGGCGGGGEGESASTASGTTQASTNASQPSQQSTTAQDEDKAKAKTDGSSTKTDGKEGDSQSTGTAGTVKVPPISSAPLAGSEAPAPGVKTVKGGDNSVQTYGTEADEAARTEAAIALQAYLNARAEEDWGRACSYLAQRPKQELEKLSQQAQQQGQELEGCAGVMEALIKGTPRSQLEEEATITEVLSFRGGGDVPGDPSYLIFTSPPGSTLRSMPMYLEAGGWKVGLAQPSELPV